MSAKHSQIVALLRPLFLIASQNDFSVYLKHACARKKNDAIADSYIMQSVNSFFLSCTTGKSSSDTTARQAHRSVKHQL